MIALVSGTVAVRRSDHVVIDCGGVGYRLAVSSETLRHVPAVGREALLHTHLVVRDDALALYGFATEEERELFLMLLGVQAVGPKVALAVLSGGPPRELLAALAAGDTARLQAAPGVGKRTAERIIVELREKVGVTPAEHVIQISRRDDPRSLARDGLLELGYSAPEADELLEGATGERAEDLIAARAEDGSQMTPAEARLQDPSSRRPEDEFDRSLRPRRLEDFVGQEALKDQLAVSIAAACSRGEALDHVLLAGPPGLGKTSLAQIVAAELGVAVRADRRARARAQGRRGRVPDGAREPRRVLRRRDPPAAAGARGDVLPGDGGRLAADHRRPGRGGAGGDARAPAVHADRRDHEGRAADHPAARPVRDPAPSRALRRRRSRADRAPLRAAARGGDRRRRRTRDRAAQPRHPARRQPAAQAGARLCPGARATG